MKSEHVELIKKLLQQEIDKDVKMFNEAGEVDWNFGRWYLASQLLTTIKMLEQEEEEEEEEEIGSTQAKKAMERIKAYCKEFDRECERPNTGEKCIFELGDECLLYEFSPLYWEVPKEKSL